MSEADAARVTFAPQVVAILFTDTTGATVIAGGSLSFTVTSKEQVTLVQELLAVTVTGVVPPGKVDPEGVE